MKLHDEMTTIPSRKNEGRYSGRVGVPPAVPRILRGTRRTSIRERTSPDVRVYSAGREIRQAGRPPYPRHAVLLSGRIFLHDGMRTFPIIAHMALIAFASLLLATGAHAKEIHSNGLGGGRWSDVATWRGGAVPGAEDDAVIAARDTVLFDRDDADKPTCKALILDPNSNFAFQGGLGKRTLTVNGIVEIHGSLKMHAQGATDDMAIHLCSTFAAERAIKVERGGALMVAGRPAFSEAKRNARISITAPMEGKVVPAGELTAGNRTMIDLQNAQLDHIAVTVTGIDNTGAKPNERCNFTGNLFNGHSRLAVGSCDTPVIARNTFDARKVPLVRPAALAVSSCPIADIRENRVLGPFAIGISITSSEGSASGNYVENCPQGIVWHTGPAMLKGNSVHKCQTGLALRTVTGSAEDTTIDDCELPLHTAAANVQLTTVAITNPPKDSEWMTMTASAVQLLNCNLTPERIKSTRDKTLPRIVREADVPVQALSFLVVQLKGDVPRGAMVRIVTTKPTTPLAPGAQDPNVRNSPAVVRADGSTPLPGTLIPLIVKTWAMDEDGNAGPIPVYTLTILAPAGEAGAAPKILKSVPLKPDEKWFRAKPNDPVPTLEVTLP